MPAANQMARHRRAHDAQAAEADLEGGGLHVSITFICSVSLMGPSCGCRAAQARAPAELALPGHWAGVAGCAGPVARPLASHKWSTGSLVFGLGPPSRSRRGEL